MTSQPHELPLSDSQRRVRRFCRLALVAAVLAAVPANRAEAQFCGFCFQPIPTLCEQWRDAESIVIARRIKSIPTHHAKLALSIYEVESVQRAKADCSVRKGDRFVRHEQHEETEFERVIFSVTPVVREEDARDAVAEDEEEDAAEQAEEAELAEDELVDAIERKVEDPEATTSSEEEPPLEMRESDTLRWETLCGFTPERLKFLSEAPAAEADEKEAVRYFCRFIASDDSLLAEQAFDELSSRDDGAATGVIPRETLRCLVRDPELSATKVGYFAILLGRVGDVTDAEWLERKILERTEELRIELPGLMTGYLWITKDKGLERLLDEFLNQADRRPFSERYAVLHAMTTVRRESNDRLSTKRTERVLYRLITFPDTADIAIHEFQRDKVWSAQDLLSQLVDHPDYQERSVQRAICRYCRASLKDFPVDPGEAALKRIEASHSILKRLRDKNPRIELSIFDPAD